MPEQIGVLRAEGVFAGTVAVRGLRDLERAFKLAGKQTAKEMRVVLAEIAEPVRLEAQRLARSEISGLRKRSGFAAIAPWAQMRTGVTQRYIYVAPKQHGTFTKRNPQRYARPNLKQLLLGKAMDPALDHKLPLIESRVGQALDRLGRTWEAA